MSDDQFTKLFHYIEEFRAETKKEFAEMRRDHAELSASVAELGAHLRDYHQEVEVLSHQFDKLREAVLQIAKATGVKLHVEL